MMITMRLSLILAISLAHLFGTAVLAQDDFFNDHCIECHGDKDPEGGLSLTTLKPDFANDQDVARWQNVLEQVVLGQMPPNEQPIPSAGATQEFTTCLLYTSPSPRDLSTSRMPSSA